ncbi:penicillin-binding protein 2 [Pelagicoccus sp. NFK12]|uniref:Penicillin-binding protein 2 n=1 Tax=Pelagicoccus enzymogenes TaxID=2773457 RepID=A0A927IG26_9BACT|nr:penicillin-binding protein 2 [Pelagicoccus enzymogenes]MBD5780732.1 penicillin-binding protein 2 [Pelagicoccus enzymogenes]MDQ8200104.1 penicillin-binding protein 2 [Pelagicoccus enzymogenes]
MASRPGTKFRFWILALFFLCGYGAIGFRLVELHAFKSPEFVDELENSRFRVLRDMPRRGDIFDINGEILATSHIFLEVGVDRHEIQKADLARIPDIAKNLDIPVSHVREAFGLSNGRLPADVKSLSPRWKLLKRRVEPRSFEPLRAMGIRCVTSTKSYEREYPQGDLASHVIGFVRKDGQAAMGVEREFDYYLSGEEGWTETEIGAGRREMAQFRRRQVTSTDGLNVVLTIDSYVQDVVQKELKEIVKNFDPKAATIIVSDPYTGELLGLANYPSFDPNAYSQSNDESRKNRALTDILEPGSTFKIVAATAALEERVVSVDTEIDCAEPIAVMPDGYRVRLPKDDHPMGILSVGEVISKSSNRGAAHLGFKLGGQNFYDWVERYGFGDYSGLDLGVESRGILNPPNKWDRLTLSRMTMGHSIAATPIQIHMATSTLANGGVLMTPRVVAAITNYEGDTVVEFGPVPKRKVFSRGTARTVAALLEEAASERGTARRAMVEGYRVAGKTGTTQKIIDGRYSSREHVGSFTGFFPANNPQVVITVIVDNGRPATGGLGYGGIVAAPSFREIAKKLIPHYAITPSPKATGYAQHETLNRETGDN